MSFIYIFVTVYSRKHKATPDRKYPSSSKFYHIVIFQIFLWLVTLHISKHLDFFTVNGHLLEPAMFTFYW